MSKQIQTGSKKPGRGMARPSLDLIAAMSVIAKAAQPITGRGIGYRLQAVHGRPDSSMSTNEMQKVYRLLGLRANRATSPGRGSSTKPANWNGFRPGRTPSIRADCSAVLSSRFLGPAALPRGSLV